MTETPEQTARWDFARVWREVSNKREIEATATLETIGFVALRPGEDSELPRVDHLMTLGEVLGAGGNGEVVSAEQLSLHRVIAVKRPHQSHDASGRLLREARIIGYLEHPNIPPVHFVGSGDGGQLLVGLKRIEGETLTERLARERGAENLDENLDVLIHVCNAVGFAHSRGVLHLDLKPDNIMTGHYGEVYVLDWGIAVAYRDDAAGGRLRGADDEGVRGTPAFLAPEMITGGPLTPETDVYLLGGLLHYLLTHEPPNAGATALEAMHSSYDPPRRVFDAHVPRPLADICRRALAGDPADRFGDADEFRRALIDYQRVRRELEALTVAELQITRLQQALQDNVAEPAAIYQQYGAARQAIDEAGRLRTSEAKTRPLLQRVLEEMIRWELRRENVGGAELLLAGLPRPNADLSAACERQRDQRSNAAAELRALRSEFDPTVGTIGKVGLAAGVGVTIAALEVIPYLLDIPPTTERVVGGYVVYILALGLMTFAARRTLFQTRTNRALTLSIWLLSIFALLLRVGAQVDLLPLHSAIGYDLVLVCLVESYATITLDRRLIVGLPFYIAAAVVAFVLPHLALVAFGMGHLVGLSSIALALGYGSTRRTS